MSKWSCSCGEYIYKETSAYCSIQCYYVTFTKDCHLTVYVLDYISEKPGYISRLFVNDQNSKLCEFSHINRKWKNFASVYMKKWLINDLIKIVLEY